MLQRRVPRTSRASSPRSDRSTSRFEQAMAAHYGGSIVQADYVAETADALSRLGFARDNTLACVAACRDEIASSVVVDVDRRWGSPFSLVSLAGMVTAGRTGLGAALAHAPVVEGRRRVVCYAMPHIAISADGVIGEVERRGVPTPSHACGALSALQRDLRGAGTALSVDRLDAEQTLLAERLGPAIAGHAVPDLLELTGLAAEAIEEDLWHVFANTVDDRRADPPVDWALLAGTQIHGPGGVDHVQPRSGHVSVNGTLHVIDPVADADLGVERSRRPRARRWLARGAAATPRS